jgi:hypothetical protein
MFRQIVRNAPLARASLRSRAVPASRVPLFAQASAQPSLVLQRRSASTASSADSSTSTPPPEERKGLKISWLFGGLVSAGLLVTIYGL